MKVYYKNKNEDIETVESYEFYVPYKEKDEDVLGSPNVNQKGYKNSFGDLFIVISKNEDIKEYFDINKIDTEDYLNFHYRMLSIQK